MGQPAVKLAPKETDGGTGRSATASTARTPVVVGPFGNQRGEAAGAVDEAVAAAAAELLCRFGPALGEHGSTGADRSDARPADTPPRAPASTPRWTPATPLERAALRLAQGIVAASTAPLEQAPVWVRRAASQSAARLATLTRAERAVAQARLGLDGQAVPTLEATAGRLTLDIDRVQQLETDALAKLARITDEATPADRTALALLVWYGVTDGRMHLPSDALADALPVDRLSLPLRPLAALLGDPRRPRRAGTLVDHLTETGTRTRWRLAATGLRSGEEHAGVPLPNRLDTVLPAVPGDGLDRAAALAGSDRRLHLGYVIPLGAATRHRRAVEALHTLSDSAEPFVDVATLFERHRTRFGTPGCSLRTYARTLADCPHLFVRGLPDRWAALDDAPARDRSTESGAPGHERRARPEAVDAEADDNDVRPDSPRARVHDLLDAGVALSTSEIAARLDGASRSAVASLVDDDPALVRYAPGLVARRDTLDAPGASPPAALLNEAHWRFASDALRSGERPDDPEPLYPAWRGSALDALVRWGRDDGLRLVEAREALRDEDLGASPAGFEPKHLIAMAIACAARDSIGWMRLNRLLGARVDSREAIWPIALLAGIGVVAIDVHWQHPLTTNRSRARTLRSALSALARTRTRLGWRDAALRELLITFDARAELPRHDGSAWLHGRRVAAYLDKRLSVQDG